jgi:lysozyme family protein
MAGIFEQALTHTLQFEGGYVDDPADPGGETKYGISKRANPDVDIAHLTLVAAREIYRARYWQRPGFDQVAQVSPDIAARLFDLGVNCGPVAAGKMLQRAINIVCTGTVPQHRRAPWRQAIARLLDGEVLRVDGAIGPITLAVLRDCPYKRALLMALKGEAYNYYACLNPLYIPGWLERLAA